ncbi:MAG: YicC/YloC family endoribonuclease [Burkholderiaceae bacterium]
MSSHSTQPADNVQIYSMTGFGQAQVASQLCRLSMQLKSVNSRFLDLSIKLPDELAPFEGHIRETLTRAVKRGKLECKISWQTLLPSDENSSAQLINHNALQQALALQNALLAQAPNAAPLSVNTLLNWPGVVPSSAGAADVLGAVTTEQITELTQAALAQFLASRAHEGAHLKQTIVERLDAIQTIVADLRIQLPELLAHQEQKLTERLLKALDAGKNDVAIATSAIPREELLERIKQEVSLTAIRIDVAEELDRLDGHLRNARQNLSEGGNVGKKLDFLMQEFNREANTLGSKSASLTQTQASLELKLIIEQMREQVQNLE